MKYIVLLLLTLLLVACGSTTGVEYRIVSPTPRPTREATPVTSTETLNNQSVYVKKSYLIQPAAWCDHLAVGQEFQFSFGQDCPN